MWEQVERRLRDAARRAGLQSVPAPALMAGFCLGVAAIAWALWHWWPTGATEFVAADVPAESAVGQDASALATEQAGAESTMCVVHVVGAVRHPGVYRLTAGSRVDDAVQQAGGLLADAAVEGLNLARLVTDGEQVFVPDRDSVAAGPVPAPIGDAASAQGAAPGAGSGEQVDLNAATAAELDTLPGIGPSTAEKIIAEREANGPFASVEDLGRVSGIGPKKIEALKDVACVR